MLVFRSEGQKQPLNKRRFNDKTRDYVEIQVRHSHCPQCYSFVRKTRLTPLLYAFVRQYLLATICVFFFSSCSLRLKISALGENLDRNVFPVEDLPGEVVLHQSRRYNRQETREESQIQYSFTKLPTDTVLYTGYCTAACANSPACLPACPRVCVRATKKNQE